jgi:hypothetical protein
MKHGLFKQLNAHSLNKRCFFKKMLSFNRYFMVQVVYKEVDIGFEAWYMAWYRLLYHLVHFHKKEVIKKQ